VFNRLYEHAINLRLKKQLKTSAAEHMHRLMTEKTTTELKQRNSARSLAKQQSKQANNAMMFLSIEQFGDLEQVCSADK